MPKMFGIWQRKMLEIPVNQAHLVGRVICVETRFNVRDFVCELFTIQYVAAFRFRRVIITNMDRTRRLGAALAACLSGASLAHVTHGARPEDGLDMLEPGALAAQMLATPH